MLCCVLTHLQYGIHCQHISRISVFDPLLAELMYRWFCPAGGFVLDPYAGGCTRGIIAACMGLHVCVIIYLPPPFLPMYRFDVHTCSSSYIYICMYISILE